MQKEQQLKKFICYSCFCQTQILKWTSKNEGGNKNLKVTDGHKRVVDSYKYSSKNAIARIIWA